MRVQFEIGCPGSPLGNTLLVLKVYERGLKVDPQADLCMAREGNAFQISSLVSIGPSCKRMNTNFLKVLYLLVISEVWFGALHL